MMFRALGQEALTSESAPQPDTVSDRATRTSVSDNQLVSSAAHADKCNKHQYRKVLCCAFTRLLLYEARVSKKTSLADPGGLSSTGGVRWRTSANCRGSWLQVSMPVGFLAGASYHFIGVIWLTMVHTSGELHPVPSSLLLCPVTGVWPRFQRTLYSTGQMPPECLYWNTSALASCMVAWYCCLATVMFLLSLLGAVCGLISVCLLAAQQTG